MLRQVAEGIAEYIREDEFLRERCSNLTVVVEDKADVFFEISNAIAQLGVCVLIAVTGFRRTSNCPLPQGNLQIQISCYEHPTLNRDDLSSLTAQAVCERLVKILNYHKFPFFVGQMLFQDFSREDVDEANIVRGNFEVNTALGLEERYFDQEEAT